MSPANLDAWSREFTQTIYGPKPLESDPCFFLRIIIVFVPLLRILCTRNLPDLSPWPIDREFCVGICSPRYLYISILLSSPPLIVQPLPHYTLRSKDVTVRTYSA